MSSAFVSSARADDQRLADALDGLPGLYRVGSPVLVEPQLGVALGAGYGFTEAQSGESGAHHRVDESAAVGAVVASGLAFNAVANMRSDFHPDDGSGTDSGSVLDLRLGARAATALSSDFHVGLDFELRAPGAERAGDAFAHPAVDAGLLAAWQSGVGPLFIIEAGYRKDLTAESAPDAERLRRGDRIALGLSEYDAVLLGLGVERTFGRTEAFAEVTSDILIGSGAPPFAESPLRLALGARQHLSPKMTLGLVLDGTLSKRPPSLPTDPLVPIDPLVSAHLAFTYRFLPDAVPPPSAPAPKTAPPPEPVAAKPPPPKDPPPAEIAPVAHPLRVRVVDHKGHPISDATVRAEVLRPGQKQPDVYTLELTEMNVYEATAVIGGPDAQIVVKADLLKEHRQSVHLSVDRVTEVNVSLEAVAAGSQLRGLVRSYAGRGLRASIRVEPAGIVAECNEDGTFEVDVEPGDYEVVVEAEGYTSQKRRLTVGKDGVTVLNADLQKSTSQ